MIKKELLALIICTLLCTFASADPTIYFSTIPAGGSWKLTYSGGWILSFPADRTEVDLPGPPDPLYEDHVNLPSMTLSNITVVDSTNHILTAKLTPTGQLVIKNGSDVLKADVATAILSVTGKTFNAYPVTKDDLNITSVDWGYSTTINKFWSADVGGYDIDMSLVGTSNNDIFTKINTYSGYIEGNMSGNIIALIPAPGAFLLGSIGVGLVGWLRRRRKL